MLVYLGSSIFLKPNLLVSERDNKSDLYKIVTNSTISIQEKESAKIVGNEYLKIVPEEADIDLLFYRLYNKNKRLYSEIQKGNSGRIREILFSQHLEDLKKGRIVIVSGWILSETETRLCALIATT